MSAVVCLWLCSFCLERFPLPLGTLDGLRCFVIALPQPSMWLFFKIYDYCDVFAYIVFIRNSKIFSFNRSEYVIYSLSFLLYNATSTAITLAKKTVGRSSADLSADKMPDFSSFSSADKK